MQPIRQCELWFFRNVVVIQKYVINEIYELPIINKLTINNLSNYIVYLWVALEFLLTLLDIAKSRSTEPNRM
jgi:hypothetical protein